MQYRLLLRGQPFDPDVGLDPYTLPVSRRQRTRRSSTYGYSRDEFLAMTILDIRHLREDATVVRRGRWNSAVGSGRARRGDGGNRKKDGTIIDVEITRESVGHRRRAGAGCCLFGTHRDLKHAHAREKDVSRASSPALKMEDPLPDGSRRCGA